MSEMSNLSLEEVGEFFSSYNKTLKEQHDEELTKLDQHDCKLSPDSSCDCLQLMREISVKGINNV